MGRAVNFKFDDGKVGTAAVGSVDSKPRDGDVHEWAAGTLESVGASRSGKSCRRGIIGRAVDSNFDDADVDAVGNGPLPWRNLQTPIRIAVCELVLRLY